MFPIPSNLTSLYKVSGTFWKNYLFKTFHAILLLCTSDHSVYGPSQWETLLLCNTVSHGMVQTQNDSACLFKSCAILLPSPRDKCILLFYDFHIHVPCWCLMYVSCSQPLIVGGPSYTGHQHGYMMYCRPAWVTSVYCHSMIFIFMCHVDV